METKYLVRKSSTEAPEPSCPSWLKPHADGVTLTIAAHPNAKQNAIVGVQGLALKVKIAAPAVEGLATETLLRFLAERLGVKRREVEILRGATNRQKVVLVRGISVEAVQAALKLHPVISGL